MKKSQIVKDAVRLIKDNSGVSIIELVLVCAGVLILLSMAAAYSADFFNSSRLITSQQALLAIQSNTKSSFKSQGHYAGLNNIVADNLGIFPEGMVSGSSTTLVVENEYNGTVTLSVSTSSNLLQEQVWTAVSMEDCMKLGLFSPYLWVSVDINSTSIDPTSDAAMTAVNAACNATGGNTITFTSN